MNATAIISAVDQIKNDTIYNGDNVYQSSKEAASEIIQFLKSYWNEN